MNRESDETIHGAHDAALSGSETENMDLLARFYEQEDSSLSAVQSAIERVSRVFGSPTYLAFAVIFILAWVSYNLIGDLKGWQWIDKPPFFWLQGLVSANALLLTVAVLIRQDRMAQLAEHRAHLDLQINLLTEKKVTALLQYLHAREKQDQGKQSSVVDDVEVAELTKPADPEALLAAIKRQDEER